MSISHSDDRVLDRLLKQLFEKLRGLQNANYLSEFYVSREYYKMVDPNSQDENHLRIGMKKPYSPSHLGEVVRQAKQAVADPEESQEWNEIEEVKALATRAIGISNDRIGEVGKTAHIIHHFFNSSPYLVGNGLVEDARLLAIDSARYEGVLTYLEEAHGLLAQLMQEWKTGRNVVSVQATTADLHPSPPDERSTGTKRATHS